MKKIVSPGLPPWPALKYDHRRKVAIVSARHPTWRSYQIAYTFMQYFFVIVNKLVLLLLVGALYFYVGTIIEKVAVAIGLWVFYYVARILIWKALPSFLARRVFAIKTSIGFSPRKIVIESTLYRRPVVIWRNWNRMKVKCRFNIRQDSEASEELQAAQQSGFPAGHINNARVLEIVFHVLNVNAAINPNTQGNIMRAIPITEIDERVASRFTMVLSAALNLTAKRNRNTCGYRNGSDIDTA